jgi:NAD dependent epimerase/dehydratase family enzyme
MIKFALENDSVSGPVNAVAPEAVTNAQFTRVLGKVLGRPTIFPVPTFAARLLFGEMAEETMLASTRVAPDKAEKAGYQFRYPSAESALRHLLGKK